MDLITQPQASGRSEPIEVGGSVGQFIWDEKPRYEKNVGGGKSPLYLFVDKTGESKFLRLEKNKQGGRWEQADHASGEYEQILQNPDFAYDMWGKTPTGHFLYFMGQQGRPWKEVAPMLEKYNTWRQISGD